MRHRQYRVPAPRSSFAGFRHRAIDQFGQDIDVLVSEKRDLATTRRFFTRALEHGLRPTEVTADRAAAYARVLDELLPPARHVTSDTRKQSPRIRSWQTQGQIDPDVRTETAALPPVSSAPATRSSKTSGAATTNSACPDPKHSSRWPSPSSPSPSDHDSTQDHHTRIPSTQQCPRNSFCTHQACRRPNDRFLDTW